ncbi:tyrosine-type recombinase/integrase [Aestuariispira insulae]|nr:tyrosine-type recombinase/integrase [Aestuariispira insulae]
MVYFLALYTGQRISDVLKMTWKHIKGNVIEVVQEKTGTTTWIPLHPTLQDEIRAYKHAMGDKLGYFIIVNQKGKAYTADGFRSVFHKEINACGLGGRTSNDGCTIHGLRKNASTALAEAGCTEKEIMAITGHKTMAMVQHYTRDAQRKLLAQSAMRKWENRS